MRVTAAILQKVWIFASKAHANQKRKGNDDPYIVHPLDLMLLMIRIKNSNNPYLVAAVSLLHDTVEDCDITIEEIAKEFGYQIASLVDELTTDKKLCEKLGKTVYLINKMLNMSSYALRIKLGDRLKNCLDMEGIDKKSKEAYFKQTKVILKNLKKRKLTKTHKKLIKLIKKAIK